MAATDRQFFKAERVRLQPSGDRRPANSIPLAHAADFQANFQLSRTRLPKPEWRAWHPSRRLEETIDRGRQTATGFDSHRFASSRTRSSNVVPPPSTPPSHGSGRFFQGYRSGRPITDRRAAQRPDAGHLFRSEQLVEAVRMV